MAATMHDLLTLMIERGASDLHITTGTHPQIRLHGKLTALTQFDVQMPPDTQRSDRVNFSSNPSSRAHSDRFGALIATPPP